MENLKIQKVKTMITLQNHILIINIYRDTIENKSIQGIDLETINNEEFPERIIYDLHLQKRTAIGF